MKFLASKLNRSQMNGDTIIEVLISISILALVLAVSYVSTSNSLHQGTNASNRLQGLSFAQQQIEVIKNAETAHPAAFTSLYQQATPFCVDPANIDTSPNYGYTALAGGATCPFGNSYTVTDSYSNGLFTVTSTWPSAGSGTQNQLQVFYRIPVAGAFTASSSSGVGGSSSGVGGSSSGVGGSTSSGGGGGSPPTCTAFSIANNGGGHASINGDCSLAVTTQYKITFSYKDKIGTSCGSESFGPQSSSTFSYQTSYAQVSAVGYVIGTNAFGTSTSNPATGGWTIVSGLTC